MWLAHLSFYLAYCTLSIKEIMHAPFFLIGNTFLKDLDVYHVSIFLWNTFVLYSLFQKSKGLSNCPVYLSVLRGQFSSSFPWSMDHLAAQKWIWENRTGGTPATKEPCELWSALKLSQVEPLTSWRDCYLSLIIEYFISRKEFVSSFVQQGLYAWKSMNRKSTRFWLEWTGSGGYSGRSNWQLLGLVNFFTSFRT